MSIPQLSTTVNGFTYSYDQLNRIKQVNRHEGIQNGWTSPISKYHEEFTYDANGNILSVIRNDSNGAMDNLAYQYNKVNGQLVNNKLNFVTNGTNTANSFTSQSTGNYDYDAIGNLIKDKTAGISNIDWTVYGKIKAISKAGGNLDYSYNSAGQRVSKLTNGLTTWYVRDAQGNTMAVYDNAAGSKTWKEQHLYGSSRLGTWNPNVAAIDNNSTTTGKDVWQTVGTTQYELSNHLGNVMATITDKRLQVDNGSGGIASYTPDVSSAQEYYAFGSLMPGRAANATGYRYGFNGKENDNDVGKGTGNQQDYGMRIYDPQIGKFLSVDPLSSSYPWNSEYAYAENRVISGVDLDGGEYKDVNGNAAGPLNETYAKKTNATLLPGFTTQPKLQLPKEVKLITTAPPIPTIALADMYGNGHIGPAPVVKDQVEAVRMERVIRTGENIKNGIFGTLGYYIGGDKGSDVGAIGDGLAMSTSGIKEPVFQTELEPIAIPEINFNTRIYNPAKPTLLKANLTIPASRNGGAPDFSSTPYLYETLTGQFNLVQIKLTGSYTVDFATANKEANLPGTPKGYTWHHLDDYNTSTGRATMQLVKTDVHQKTVPHTGSVKQYEKANNVKYKP